MMCGYVGEGGVWLFRREELLGWYKVVSLGDILFFRKGGKEGKLGGKIDTLESREKVKLRKIMLGFVYC